MSNLTADAIYRPVGREGRNIHLPVDGGTTLYRGQLVSQLTATAMLVPFTTSGAGPALGMCTHGTVNSGSDGAKRAVVEHDRVFNLANSTSTDEITEAYPLLAPVYGVDDHTVADNDAGGTRQFAGFNMGVQDDGTVNVYVGMHAVAMLGGAAASAASKKGEVLFSIVDLREVTSGGDVANIAANGGILASDSTPILRGDAAGSQEVSWAAGNADVVMLQAALPSNFDGSGDVGVVLDVYTDNAGGGGIDAATFTVETSWDGSALVSDTATDGTPAITVHTVTATVAAADVPNTARNVTILLTPAAHANDPVQLVGARLIYEKVG